MHVLSLDDRVLGPSTDLETRGPRCAVRAFTLYQQACESGGEGRILLSPTPQGHCQRTSPLGIVRALFEQRQLALDRTLWRFTPSVGSRRPTRPRSECQIC